MTTTSIQVEKILKALQGNATFHGATIVECSGAGRRVSVTLCCVGHANNMTKTFRAVGMKILQDGCKFTIWYPSDSERRRMQ